MILNLEDIQEILQEIYDDFSTNMVIDVRIDTSTTYIMGSNKFDKAFICNKAYIIIKRRSPWIGSVVEYLDYYSMLPYLEEIKDRLEDSFIVKISIDGKSGTKLNEFPDKEHFCANSLEELSIYSIWIHLSSKMTNERIKNFKNFE